MPDDSRYVSAEIAARRLGVSAATVRRRIRAGTLEGTIDRRPQGEVYLVLAEALPPDSDVTPPDDSESVSPDSDVASAIRAATEPLEKRLTLADEQIAAKDATILRQAEVIGRLQSDASHLARQVTDLTDRLATAANDLEAERTRMAAELEETRRPWWRKLIG